MIAKGVYSAVCNPLNMSVILKMEMMTNNIPEQVHESCYYILFAKNTRYTGCTTIPDGLEERLLGLHQSSESGDGRAWWCGQDPNSPAPGNENQNRSMPGK